MPRKSKTQDELNAEIIAGLDIKAEYESLGVTFAADAPRASGNISCYSRRRGQDDRNPSAFVSCVSGRYGDSSTGEKHSLWDFAVEYGPFTDWKQAREHFAAKAGVKLAGGKRAASNPLVDLEFMPWNEGAERLVKMWCLVHKKGITVNAVRENGGMLARWKCYTDKKTGERRFGKYTVVALPAYHPDEIDMPRAWVIWNVSGPMLSLYRGKGEAEEEVKMVSVGETHGLLMGKYALERIAAKKAADVVWKTGGPGDMLAMYSAIQPEFRERHLVATNASGETGVVTPGMAGVFAGYDLGIIHDADEAGETGAGKWLRAAHGVANTVRQVRLPYPVVKKSGRDARDWLLGVTA